MEPALLQANLTKFVKYDVTSIVYLTSFNYLTYKTLPKRIKLRCKEAVRSFCERVNLTKHSQLLGFFY